MFKKLAIATAVVSMVLPLTAQAGITQKSGRSVEQIYKQCGIGGMLFGNSSEILAIISNVTWDLGTTAAISDSMSPDTCNGGNVRAAVLIKESFPSLEANLAAGEGSHLTALADVAGCDSTAAIRNSYGKYAQTDAYATASKQQNVDVLYNIVSSTCSM